MDAKGTRSPIIEGAGRGLCPELDNKWLKMMMMSGNPPSGFLRFFCFRLANHACRLFVTVCDVKRYTMPMHINSRGVGSVGSENFSEALIKASVNLRHYSAREHSSTLMYTHVTDSTTLLGKISTTRFGRCPYPETDNRWMQLQK